MSKIDPDETIVIPFRGPWGAKSRLGHSLTEPMRASLAAALFRHVLAEAMAAHAGPVLVVTPSSEAARLAQRVGAEVLRETTGTLNGALTAARKTLAATGVVRMAVIAADLALLEADDIATLLAAARAGNAAGLAIAPDRSGTGTNAMSLPVGGEFTFHYGHKSLAAHRQQAARLGIGAALVDRPGLAADLDTVDDLAMLDDSFVRLGPDLRRAIARARGGIDA